MPESYRTAGGMARSAGLPHALSEESRDFLFLNASLGDAEHELFGLIHRVGTSEASFGQPFEEFRVLPPCLVDRGLQFFRALLRLGRLDDHPAALDGDLQWGVVVDPEQFHQRTVHD
jgi:hypothetical protein